MTTRAWVQSPQTHNSRIKKAPFGDAKLRDKALYIPGETSKHTWQRVTWHHAGIIFWKCLALFSSTTRVLTKYLFSSKPSISQKYTVKLGLPSWSPSLWNKREHFRRLKSLLQCYWREPKTESENDIPQDTVSSSPFWVSGDLSRTTWDGPRR